MKVPWQQDESTDRPYRRVLVYGLTGSLSVLAATGTLLAWTAHTAAQDRHAQVRHDRYVEVAKQGALDLANIDAATVQEDVQRIIDSATGNFLREFTERSTGFASFVDEVQSTSEGTVREAGLESADAERAQVVVAMAVNVSTAGAPPEAHPRSWRLRITVERAQDTMKISDVEFVP